jgi:hypothetical protein
MLRSYGGTGGLNLWAEGQDWHSVFSYSLHIVFYNSRIASESNQRKSAGFCFYPAERELTSWRFLAVLYLVLAAGTEFNSE